MFFKNTLQLYLDHPEGASKLHHTLLTIAISIILPTIMLAVFVATPSSASAFLLFGERPTKDAAYYLNKGDIHLERAGGFIWRPLAISEYQKALILSNTVVDAKRSQLGIADGYIRNREYANAISAYQVYLEFYRLDYDSPEVIYNLGYAYHKLYKGKGRRVDYQQQALVAFSELKKTYPEYYMNSNASELEKISTNRILDAEIHVGELYIRLKDYDSVVHRLEGTYDAFPQSKSLPEAQFTLAKAYYKLGNREGYDKALNNLREHYLGDNADNENTRAEKKYIKKTAKLWKTK